MTFGVFLGLPEEKRWMQSLSSCSSDALTGERAIVAKGE